MAACDPRNAQIATTGL